MGQRYAGRYELVDQLGEGAAGTVWRAWDHRAARFVAAKILRQRDAGALLRFVREQSLRVSHPHVAPPTGWAAEDHDVLLTMDLVGGGSVATLLGDYGRVPLAYAVVLLDQLLDALAAVHAAGLVHRDVKPGNLLLEVTGAGRPFLRLGDFGIAAVRGAPRLTHLGHVVGTPGYVSPDVLAGMEPAPQHDLWSVGVVGWQLLTGGTPAPDGAQPFRTRPAEVPPALWDWLRRLCAANPADQYADAAAARAALAAAVAGAGLTAAVSAVGVAAGADDVEVFDHLAELPAGWTPTGPRATASRVHPPAARPQVRPPATKVLTGGGQPALPTPKRRRRAPRPMTVVRLAGAAVLSAAAVVAFVAARDSTRPDEPAPTPTPSGQVAPAAQGENAGQPCDFTRVGQRRSVSAQVIQCQQSADGRSYLWVVITS